MHIQREKVIINLLKNGKREEKNCYPGETNNRIKQEIDSIGDLRRAFSQR